MRGSATGGGNTVAVGEAQLRSGNTFYKVTSVCASQERDVWRRFSEFVTLRKQLAKQLTGVEAQKIQVALPFPKKTTLRSKGNSAAVVEQRRQELNDWLQTVFFHSVGFLFAFFTCSSLQSAPATACYEAATAPVGGSQSG